MANKFPKIEHTKVICFFYNSETYCVAEYFEGQFSDSDKKTAENFGIDYFDVDDFTQFVTLYE